MLFEYLKFFIYYNYQCTYLYLLRNSKGVYNIASARLQLYYGTYIYRSHIYVS